MPLLDSFRQLPGFQQLRRSGLLKTARRKLGPYRGRFATVEQALGSLPASRRMGYDNDDLVPVGLDSYFTVQNIDWPVLFFLQKLLREGRLGVVTDFGGHIGVKYHAFRDLLPLPAGVQWQVVDVPAMVREGRRRLTPEMEALSFHERIEETRPCDLLICSGAIQYAALTFEALLAKMGQWPRVIVWNKLPLTTGEAGYVTLEDFGAASVPYRVFAADEVAQARERLGYQLTSSWVFPDRDFAVLAGRHTDWVAISGQAWTLRP